jgi:hypothetical protein
VLYVRGSGEQSFTAKRRLRADRLGRWSTPWRAVTDVQYYASGGVHSRMVATMVLPSAAAPMVTRLASGRSPVTVTGTARPGSLLVVYLRAAGSTRFVPAARVRVAANGRYLTSFVPARGLLDCFTTSSNGQRSTLWHGVPAPRSYGTMAE